jgi:hypothetical protein
MLLSDWNRDSFIKGHGLESLHCCLSVFPMPEVSTLDFAQLYLELTSIDQVREQG